MIHPSWGPCRVLTLAVAAAACRISKKRVDCKIKEAYKLGKTLGTGGKPEWCSCCLLLQEISQTSCGTGAC